MSFDRSLARCSFCGKRPPVVQRMVAGPGAAYICEACLQLCNDILSDPTPFSPKALELASRPPVVIAMPEETGKTEQTERTGQQATPSSREPVRSINIELEQRQQDMTLMLRQLQIFQRHFELHYLWIRPPLPVGFAFVPRLIFFLMDNTGMKWLGDRGGMLLARPELASDPAQAVYQGSAHFSPLPPSEVRSMKIRAADPLGQFEEPPLHPWEFEISLPA